MQVVSKRVLPDCWGHRGASAAFPENTLASFEAAIRDGAEGIESDVHVSSDNVVIMFHDSELDRTTDSTGLNYFLPSAGKLQFIRVSIAGAIKDRTWYGESGMENVRTRKEPKQSIPTFAETVTLLMQPDNQHVLLNIDVKPSNDPPRLFGLMHRIISAQLDWETKLAPRLVLGLWHPRFISAAKENVPYLKRSFIGVSPTLARTYFWNDCDFFSMSFGVLATADGERFRRECKDAGKKLMVWTVNDPEHMMEAVRWGVDCILTDVTKTWLDMRSALHADYEGTGLQYSRTFLWTTLTYWTPFQIFLQSAVNKRLQSAAGPFVPASSASVSVGA